MDAIAILYQHQPPPKREGIQKPMKAGGYSDSGADIAFCLHSNGMPVVTPTDQPNPLEDYDWVFPDSKEGIEYAMKKGAKIFWLNTVLYKGHPIDFFSQNEFEIVGQLPEVVDKYDNKVHTNHLLKQHGLPIPASVIIEEGNTALVLDSDVSFPMVVKPIRGRGSQGVSVVHNQGELNSAVNDLFRKAIFGSSVYIERYLPGQEITLTVMPPGTYEMDNGKINAKNYWTLPPVKRFNHADGIAPYNGIVAVVNNSEVLSDIEIDRVPITLIRKQCEQAGRLLDAKAPIRIDCRADQTGKYQIFDVNMKPNMTGASRRHRSDQDSLTMIAARKIGWNYFDLLRNMLTLKWHLTK